MNRRRALAALALGLAAPSALAACVGGSNQEADDQTPPPKPTVTLLPEANAVDYAPTALVSAHVRDGSFQRIALTNADGRPVAGILNQDRTSFRTVEPLGYGVTYTWGGSAVGGDGVAMSLSGSFTTVAPDVEVNGQFQLADGQTVGVAAPIIMQFDASISDKASVERALTVTTNPPTEGSWAWLPDEVGGSRVHWRSREYFAPGTTVRVDARLYGVPFGDGAFGATDSTLDFAIGRRQVVKAEASSYRIEVVTDEGVILNLPCSYGEGDLPRNVTRSGIHVVTEKYEDFYMSNPAAGYANLRERFAVRISNNGEFIHANPASTYAQGKRNVTHGCINLSTADARAYFESALYGDPVEVTGSSVPLAAEDGDFYDWTIPYEQWKTMSALA